MKIFRDILFFSFITMFLYLPVNSIGSSPGVGLAKNKSQYCTYVYHGDIFDPGDPVTSMRSFGAAPEFDIFFYTHNMDGGEVPIKGLKLNITVTGHSNGGWEWPSHGYDIWDDYGFIVYWNDGISDKDGLSYAAVGVGNPEITNRSTWTPEDSGWIDVSKYPLRDSYNSVKINTGVALLFSAKKPSGQLSIIGGAGFSGRWYWETGWPYGGYWDDRYFGISAGGSIQNPMIANTSLGSEPLAMASIKYSSIMSNNNYRISDSNLLSRKNPQDYNTPQNGWCQLHSIDDVNYDWESFDVFAAMFFDPCDTNGDINLMTYCAPYAYIADTNTPSIVTSLATTHTMLLKSMDANSNLVSEMPIHLHVQSRNGGAARLVSDFILPMEFNSQQGVYNDYWGKVYRCIYAVEDGGLDINKDDFYGDFNVDGFVDLEDFALLSLHWNTTISDPNYDYGFDHDEDGAIDILDLVQFCENYLSYRP